MTHDYKRHGTTTLFVFRRARRGCIWSSVGLVSSRKSGFGATAFFNVEELLQAINEYLEEHNRQTKPFLWTASVEEILGEGQSL